jgi:hypothetical protein
MTAILVPSFETPEAALDWIELQGDPIRVCLMRGADGLIRGNAIVLIPVEYTAPGYNATIKLE